MQLFELITDLFSYLSTTLKENNMKNLGFGLLALFMVSLGSVTATTLSTDATTSISCDKEKCSKKKKKKKCKNKDKESCKGKEKGTESSTETK